MWREQRPGALAPGSLAGTSRRGIPAWSSSRELPGNPCDAASSFGSFPGGQASCGEPAGKGLAVNNHADAVTVRNFAAQVGWSRPEAGEPGRDRILQTDSGRSSCGELA
jgi:hypothetical protein